MLYIKFQTKISIYKDISTSRKLKCIISEQLATEAVICLFERPSWARCSETDSTNGGRLGRVYSICFAEQWKMCEVCETVFIFAVLLGASSGAEFTYFSSKTAIWIP